MRSALPGSPAGENQLDEAGLPFGREGESSVVSLRDRTVPEERGPSWQRFVLNKPCRVLFVGSGQDDFELVRELLGRADNLSFRVDWAATAEVGLRRLTALSFDVCMIDAELSDRPGIDFARIAQRRGFRTPMILLGEDFDSLQCTEAIELGVADFLEREELEVGRLERTIVLSMARQSAADRLDHLAQYDELTGLAKRALFAERLERALASARRHRVFVAVMIVDLNDFKEINDRHGHAAGDEVLRVVADRLRGRIRETDTAARLGGDEFVLVIENLAKPEYAALVARKLLDAVSPPIRVGDQDLAVSVSLGVALYPRDAEDADKLRALADAAMYVAKGHGGNACRFNDEHLDQRVRRGSILESDLLRALERDELTLSYQPQVSVGSPQIGIAAIMRWQHPGLGVVDLDRFRPIAEHHGLIEPLTAWLLDAACLQAQDWQSRFAAPFHLTVPILSRRQLAWSKLAEMANTRLQRHEITRATLELEIDESLLHEEIQAGSAALKPLADLGLRIAVDRFGSGPASLRLLREAPLSTLKLAKSLLDDVPADPVATQFVVGLIRLGKQMGLRIVVEGAETPEQLKLLRAHGCDAVQAIAGCPPLSAEACAAWLEQAQTRRS